MNLPRRHFTATLLALSVAFCMFPSTPAHAATEGAPPNNLLELRARYHLTNAAEEMLRKNGFVVLDNDSRLSLTDAYPKYGAQPYTYVTADAMLQVWFELATVTQRRQEKQFAAPTLSKAIDALFKTSVNGVDVRTPDGRRALADARTVLAVANVLGGNRVPVDRDVAETLRLIRAHNENRLYPGDDYTQYAARGYYADDPLLSRYWLQSMWLTRQYGSVGRDADLGDQPLRRAIALAAVVRASSRGRALLKSVNDFRQARNGAPNAISVDLLISAIDRCLGSRWTLDQAVSPIALSKIRAELTRPQYPRSSVATRTMPPHDSFPNEIVSLLPDYVTPDAAFFQKIVNPSIPQRSLPADTDVASMLGFHPDPTAPSRLPTYQSALTAARQSIMSSQDEYTQWMRTLSTLAQVDRRAPTYMHTPEWQACRMNTALAGWAQLRHTYLLTTAETYSEAMGMEELPGGMVEPNPAFFRALGDLAQTINEQESAAGVDGSQSPLIRAFVSKCRRFEADAKAELAGKLSDEDAHDIAEFGDWLRQFHLASKPIVADVATGENGEVWNVGTGAFYPMLVMPKAGGPAYVGWTMSFYSEVTNGEHLTDARWSSVQASADSRPERPEWASAFVALDRGDDWRQRAPLRQAEEQFIDGHPDDALAILHQAIVDHPDTKLATECQYRIGRYWADKNDVDKALTELRKCRHLPGCDAYDEACFLANNLTINRVFQSKRLQDRKSTIIDRDLDRLTAAPDSARAALERQVARDMLTIEFPAKDQLDRARALCRERDVKDVLAYAAACVTQFGIGEREDLPKLAEGVQSPAIREAILADAVLYGYRSDNPEAQIALLKPALTANLFAREDDAALNLLHRAEGTNRVVTDPKLSFTDSTQMFFSNLIQSAYDAGRYADVLRYAKLEPADNPNGEPDEIVQTVSKIAHRDYPIFAQFRRLTDRVPYQTDFSEQSSTPEDARSARALEELVSRHPRFPFAEQALESAESLYRYAGLTSDADRILSTIARHNPKSMLVILRRAETAADRGNIAVAARICAPVANSQYSSTEPGPVSDFDGAIYQDIIGLAMSLKQEQTLRSAVRGLVPAASWPRFANKLLNRETAVSLADHLIAAGAQPEAVFKALLNMKYGYGYDLPLEFLHRFPDSPDVADIFKQREFGERLMCRDGDINWVAQLIDRGPSYRYAAQVADLLAASLGNGSLLQERCKVMLAEWHGKRSAACVVNIAADDLLRRNRPEDALDILNDDVGIRLPATDPLIIRKNVLLARAGDEINAKHAAAWTPIWTAKLPPPNSDDIITEKGLRPVISGNVVVAPLPAGDQTKLTGIDANNGSILWSTSLPAISAIASDDSRIYCAINDGAVKALDPAKGSVLWSVSVGRDRGTVAVIGNIVVASSTTGPTRGLVASTGATAWEHDWPLLRSAETPFRIAVSDGICCLPSADAIVAFDPATGNKYWTQILGTDQRFDGTIIAAPNGRFIKDGQRSLDMIDGKTGEIVLTAGSPQFPSFPDTFISDGRIGLVYDVNGVNVVVDLSTLALTLNVLKQVRLIQPATVDNGIAYFADTEDAEMDAVDLATGAQIGWIPLDTNLGVASTVSHDRVYAVAGDGRVMALPAIR